MHDATNDVRKCFRERKSSRGDSSRIQADITPSKWITGRANPAKLRHLLDRYKQHGVSVHAEELGKHGRDKMSEALHEDKTGYKVG